MTTLGCTKNLVDSEVMLHQLKEYQLTDEPRDADLLIINSCGFIQSAKEESVQTVFELDDLRKEESKLLLSGCFSERYKSELEEALPEVDIFTGVADYHRVAELVKESRSQFSEKTFLIKDEDRVITGSASHSYIKIGEGCNQRCSFCSIPLFKGKLQSRDLQNIEKEVEKLIERGYYDFSFISQDSSSYMRDCGQKDGLIDLINRVENIDGVESARILYLYPSTTSMEFIERVGESEKFHNYFDLPIQHISDKMLKVMRRGAGREKTVQLLKAMRELPNSFLRTSFIVGHPEESEDDFNEIVQFITDFRFDMINIFAYSDEEDTHSYEIEKKVPDSVIEERVAILEEIVEEQRVENLQKMVGKEIVAVVDGESSEHEFLLSAKALHWTPEIDGEIYINDKEVEKIEFSKPYSVQITELVGDKLLGTVLKEHHFR
jgi:ribosomal protein S12 methylthiotransferase RimO